MCQEVFEEHGRQKFFQREDKSKSFLNSYRLILPISVMKSNFRGALPHIHVQCNPWMGSWTTGNYSPTSCNQSV